MRLIFGLCLLPSLLLGTPQGAPHRFSFGAEWIFFRPDGLNGIASESLSASREKELLLDTRFKSGFRLEGIYAFDCTNDLGARFTHFNQTYPLARTGNFGLNPFPAQERLKADLNYRLFAAEVILNKTLIVCPDFNFLVGAGLHYRNLEFTSHLRENNLGGSARETSFEGTNFKLRSKGVGPELHLAAIYSLFSKCWGDLSLIGDARATLLTSREESKSSKTSVSIFETDVFIDDVKPSWTLKTACDLRCGLGWTYCCRCFTPSVMIGYEWLLYELENVSVSFQGPFINVGAAF